MLKIKASPLMSLLLVAALGAQAQDKAAIEKQLASEYALTKTTADLTDIVTAGCVLVLKKDNLITVPITDRNFNPNVYKNGRITQKIPKILMGNPSFGGTATRTFVTGEKVWVTAITVREKDILFDLYTDAIADIRYKASLSFPFQKGSDPSVEQVDKTISEVFSIQASDNGKAQPAPAAAPVRVPPSTPAAPPPVREAAPAPIAPPPPPSDAPQAEPKTISLGQTPEQVESILGKPQKKVNLPGKQIYFYKDLKVTFLAGKVSDVQ